jgi:hypothetical protein
MKDFLTQELRCELNSIRTEIEKMECLSDRDKLFALSDLVRNMLELYTPESVLGSARWQLERCRKLNGERSL